MILLAYICSILMGSTLGLIGGGGSILTVPILVYMFGIDPITATGYSLFVVGSTALVGSITYFRKGLVDVKTGIIFALPSFVGVYMMRRFGIPALPETIFTVGSYTIDKATFIMLVFGAVMLATAYSMIRKSSPKPEHTQESLAEGYPYVLIAAEGLIVGAVTGLVGAGGGFLIVPALVMLARLPMKQAVGTSLMIIAIKSLFGFSGELQTEAAIDWETLLSVSGLAVIGIIIGGRLSQHVPSKTLMPAFGIFVFLMGSVILGLELA
ncbi:MAG: sulfite exporter TauE/SafE family protein [Magnetovibrio sp.]|nr:sulfite exporter TauE/SafE family protein [Magnetovibrio sp.]